MNRLIPMISALAALAAALFCSGCGGYGLTPISTRPIEEKYLDEGYANRMYQYGHDLAAKGKIQEAYQAYLSAETTAFTFALRQAARKRRLYMEQVLTARREGRTPPLPPVVDVPHQYLPPVPKPDKPVFKGGATTVN